MTYLLLEYSQSYSYLCRRAINENTTFPVTHIVILPTYPSQIEGMNLDVALVIALPGSANQPILIPQTILVAISLRSATPFYLLTGRPVLKVSPLSEGTKSLLVALGSSVPVLLILVATVALSVW